MDILHLAFGALGGQLTVVRGIAATTRALGLRSAAVSYTRPDEHIRDSEVWADVDEVRFIDKVRRIDLGGARRIGAAIAELRPQALLLHSPHAPLPTMRSRVLRRTRVALLVEHTPLPVRSHGDDLRSLLALASARGVVVLTPEYAASYPLRRAARARRAEVRVIPNGIDTHLFTPLAQARPHDGPVVIGMAARINPLKDVRTLVTAAAVLRERGSDVTVRIAGDGPDVPDIARHISELDLADRAHLDGMLGEEDLASWFRGLDIYVHASFGEALSTSVLQAYASGLPCVVSDVPGLTGLADGPDGFGTRLVPVRDPHALADAVAALIVDPASRSRMGATNRARAEREYGLAVMTDRYLSFLDRLDPSGPWAAARARAEPA